MKIEIIVEIDNGGKGLNKSFFASFSDQRLSEIFYNHVLASHRYQVITVLHDDVVVVSHLNPLTHYRKEYHETL